VAVVVEGYTDGLGVVETGVEKLLGADIEGLAGGQDAGVLLHDHEGLRLALPVENQVIGYAAGKESGVGLGDEHEGV